MTTIERMWLEMESEKGTEWRMRRARKDILCPLLLAVHPSSRSRVLLIAVPEVSLPLRRDWPECQGLEWYSVGLGDVPYWGVRLQDPSMPDVFNALAEDLAERMTNAAGPEQAAAGLMARLKRWQYFLKTSSEGLGAEARRGLWGELYVLHSHLLPLLGLRKVVEGWKGSEAAHQDFQFEHSAVEVKTTSAKQPQSIRITSERQLDDTGVGELFLHVVIVDEREVPARSSPPSQSLADLVQAVREDLAADPSVLLLFNERLFERGWLDAQAHRYESCRLTVRTELIYRVQEGFPRLVEGDMPLGVGDANYALALGACGNFIIPLSEMQAVLTLSDATPQL